MNIVPVGLEISKSGFQIIEQVHFLAALRTVDVQQLTVIQLAHFLRSVPSTEMTMDALHIVFSSMSR